MITARQFQLAEKLQKEVREPAAEVRGILSANMKQEIHKQIEAGNLSGCKDLLETWNQMQTRLLNMEKSLAEVQFALRSE